MSSSVSSDYEKNHTFKFLRSCVKHKGQIYTNTGNMRSAIHCDLQNIIPKLKARGYLAQFHYLSLLFFSL